MSRNIYKDISPHQLGIIQSRATRNIQELRETILAEYGLTSPAWFVLGYVKDQTVSGGVRVGDIAAMLDVQSTYITGILRKLEAKELVQWLIDKTDRRARIVTTTKKGAAVADAIASEAVKHEQALLGQTSDATIQNYVQVLELQAHMNQAA